MLTLARYTLKGPFQAAGVVGLLVVLAVFLMPLAGVTMVTAMVASLASLFAMVLVGLIILTQGLGGGLKVIASSALVAMLAAWLALKSPGPGIAMVVVQWVPVIILAHVLRTSRSMAITVLTGIAVGLVVLALLTLLSSGLEHELLSRAAQQGGGAALTDEQRQQIDQTVRQLKFILAPSLYLESMLIIFLARWLQARLGETGGFGREFQSLKLGRPTALIALVIVSLGLWLKLDWLSSVALMLVIAFMFQGIAVVHSRLGGKKQGFPLLVLFYVLLVFSVSLMGIPGILTSIAGMIDNWFGFRGRPPNPTA